MRIFFAFAIVLSFSCNQNKAVEQTDSDAAKAEVAQVEESMFNSIRDGDPNFWKTVSDSYVSINADGAMVTKEETVKDSLHRKMFVGIDHKLLDHNVRVFGEVGICNGRAQFYMQKQMVAEVYYTAIFRKANNKWIYEGWQGTFTKNTPKQPG